MKKYSYNYYVFDLKIYIKNLFGYYDKLYIFFLKTIFLFFIFKFIYDCVYFIIVIFYEIYMYFLNFIFSLIFKLIRVINIIFKNRKILKRFFIFFEKRVKFIYKVLAFRANPIAYKRKLDNTNIFAIILTKQWDLIVKFFGFMIILKGIFFYIIYILFFIFAIFIGFLRFFFLLCFFRSYLWFRFTMFKLFSDFWYVFIFNFMYKIVVERFILSDTLYGYHFKYLYRETKKLFFNMFDDEFEDFYILFFKPLPIFKSLEYVLGFFLVILYIINFFLLIFQFILCFFFYFFYFFYELYCLIKFFLIYFLRLK